VAVYTYTQYKNEVIDSARAANITNVITARNPLNRGVRRVLERVDLRSTKRHAALGTRLFDDIYSYPAPTDLKGDAIIGLFPQANRNPFFRLDLKGEEDFDRLKTVKNNIVALATDDLANRIMFSGDVNDTTLLLASCDSLTADGGTWVVYSDAANLAADADNYVQGGGSLKFDLTGAATTAGIYNTSLTLQDISDYTTAGFAFVWVYINSITNLTNFILEIGNDLTTNYYQITETDQFDGTAFVAGWNLLMFSFSAAMENGTVDDEVIGAVRFYMTKTSGKSDDGYRVDEILLHTGEIHNILYYSKYGWQNSSGTFIENSTADTDYLNADTDEFDGFVFRGKAELFRELRRFDLAKDAMEEYALWETNYIRRNPSQRLKLNRFYYNPTLYNRRF